MGFRLNRKYALRWNEGTDLAGLEIDMRSTSVGTFTEVQELRVSRDEKRLAEILADHVIRWNFEDEAGNPLPVNAASVLAQESPVLKEIARQWFLAAAGVSAPLDLGSTNTPPSEEASIPMETS